MRKNSIKNTRINMEVQRELSEIIRGGIKDPRIHPMTSVIAVEVTPDLKYCKAYISVLGNEDAGKATIEGLKSAEGYVRRELARRVNLRNTPQIKFPPDRRGDKGPARRGAGVSRAGVRGAVGLIPRPQHFRTK